MWKNSVHRTSSNFYMNFEIRRPMSVRTFERPAAVNGGNIISHFNCNIRHMVWAWSYQPYICWDKRSQDENVFTHISRLYLGYFSQLKWSSTFKVWSFILWKIVHTEKGSSWLVSDAQQPCRHYINNFVLLTCNTPHLISFEYFFLFLESTRARELYP